MNCCYLIRLLAEHRMTVRVCSDRTEVHLQDGAAVVELHRGDAGAAIVRAIELAARLAKEAA